MMNIKTKKEIQLIINRLKKIASVKNDLQLSEILNTNANTFSSWKNQNYQIPLENLVYFCNTYGCSMDFVLFGKKTYQDGILEIPLVNTLQVDLKELLIYPQEIISFPKEANIEYPQNIIAYKTADNQLPITAPKGNFVIVDLDIKSAGWGCDMFLIVTDYGHLFRKLIAVPAAAENYEFIIKSENKDIDDFKLSKFKIVGKVIGGLKMEQLK